MTSISIVEIREAMIPTISELQRAAFSGQLNTRIGDSYLAAFISWFHEAEDAIALAAAHGEIVLGYVVGAPLGYTSRLNRKVFWPALLGIAVRPWLFLDSHFWQVVSARVRGMIMFSPKQQNQEKGDLILPDPTISLVAIGVRPSAQGKGIGQRLLQEFEREARAQQARSMRLSVYPDNSRAIKLYEKEEWQPMPDRKDSQQTRHYFKLLV